jgi:hypothetical protein
LRFPCVILIYLRFDCPTPYSTSIPRTVEFPLSSNRRHYLRVRTTQLNKTSLSSRSITYVMFGSSARETGNPAGGL